MGDFPLLGLHNRVAALGKLSKGYSEVSNRCLRLGESYSVKLSNFSNIRVLLYMRVETEL